MARSQLLDADNLAQLLRHLRYVHMRKRAMQPHVFKNATTKSISFSPGLRSPIFSFYTGTRPSRMKKSTYIKKNRECVHNDVKLSTTASHKTTRSPIKTINQLPLHATFSLFRYDVKLQYTPHPATARPSMMTVNNETIVNVYKPRNVRTLPVREEVELGDDRDCRQTKKVDD